MKRFELDQMSVDDLWALHVRISETLAARITAEKSELERRLMQLNGPSKKPQSQNPGRRSYPPVFPKFRNPEDPTETWAGRGKQPLWVTRQLKSGKRLEEFRIELAAE
jgi:DNA-binding protein H-NS